jgi:hypothetical protein
MAKKYPRKVKISVDFYRITTIPNADKEDEIIESTSEEIEKEVVSEVDADAIADLCFAEDWPPRKKRKSVQASIPTDQNLFMRSLGKNVQITAICVGVKTANKYMEKHPDESLLAQIGPMCFMAKS